MKLVIYEKSDIFVSAKEHRIHIFFGSKRIQVSGFNVISLFCWCPTSSSVLTRLKVYFETVYSTKLSQMVNYSVVNHAQRFSDPLGTIEHRIATGQENTIFSKEISCAQLLITFQHYLLVKLKRISCKNITSNN